MKLFRTISILVASVLLLSLNSCVVRKHDNGKHKGWYKNPRNPHNPAHVVKVKPASKQAGPAVKPAAKPAGRSRK